MGKSSDGNASKIEQIYCALDFYSATLQIHFKHELTKKSAEKFHAQECKCSLDANRAELYTMLLELEGITEIIIDRHTMHITKGQLFEWDEMIEAILLRILTAFNPNGELTQMRPAREYYWNDKKLFMKRIFRTCNLTIWQKQREVGFQDGLATTLLVAILGPQYFWLGTAGDTVGYLWHRGTVRQLTPPNRDEFGALTKALGVKRLGLIPEYASGKLEDGDALILATDGVWDFVTNNDLAIALQQKTIQAATRMLLDAARAAGSTDNRTIAVVKRVKLG